MNAPTTTTEDTAREAALPRVTPAAILEAAEDPTVFAPLFRGMGMHNAFKLGEMMKNPNVSMRDRMEWQRMCMEFGQVPKTVTNTDQNGGPSFRININIPQVGAAPPQTITLEAVQPALEEVDEE